MRSMRSRGEELQGDSLLAFRDLLPFQQAVFSIARFASNERYRYLVDTEQYSSRSIHRPYTRHSRYRTH